MKLANGAAPASGRPIQQVNDPESSDSEDDDFDPEHPVLFKNWKWGMKP